MTDEQRELVDLEVAEVRAWLASVYPRGDQDFYARVLGGGFTMRKHRKAWDAIQGYARTERAQAFCQRWSMQETMRFGRGEHGQHEALWLAQQFCDRMSFFLQLYDEGGEADDWWEEGKEALHDDLEFVNALLAADHDSQLCARGMEIRRIVPTRPA